MFLKKRTSVLFFMLIVFTYVTMSQAITSSPLKIHNIKVKFCDFGYASYEIDKWLKHSQIKPLNQNFDFNHTKIFF